MLEQVAPTTEDQIILWVTWWTRDQTVPVVRRARELSQTQTVELVLGNQGHTRTISKALVVYPRLLKR